MTNETLTEQYQRIRDEQPSPSTVAWWRRTISEIRQEVSGALHQIANLTASVRDCWGKLKSQQRTIDDQAKEIESLKAMCGELLAKITEMDERQDKMAVFLKANVKAATTNGGQS